MSRWQVGAKLLAEGAPRIRPERVAAHFALKGRWSRAQGTALGTANGRAFRALKGRGKPSPGLVPRPFRAYRSMGLLYPGRCPGLDSRALSGRRQQAPDSLTNLTPTLG